MDTLRSHVPDEPRAVETFVNGVHRLTRYLARFETAVRRQHDSTFFLKSPARYGPPLFFGLESALPLDIRPRAGVGNAFMKRGELISDPMIASR